jgi:hypothetical protein
VFPETAGGDVFTGAPLVTGPVVAEYAVAEPAEFIAVTATRSPAPTSAGATV